MSTWFIYALAAPMIWAAVNHTDKYLVSRYLKDKKPEALVVFSSLIAGVAAVLIFCLAKVDPVSSFQALAAMFAGVLFVAGFIPYMHALKEDDVSVVAPLFQMVVPLAYIFGVIFLNEALSLHQIFAGLLVIAGAVLLTINFKKFIWKKRFLNLCFFPAFFTL